MVGGGWWVVVGGETLDCLYFVVEVGEGGDQRREKRK
jgi:hypothetical protein